MHGSGDYLNMYKYLQCYEKLILNDEGVDWAAEAPTKVVSNAVDSYVPKRSSRPNKFPSWFS